jgi:ribosome biogenesis GTPase
VFDDVVAITLQCRFPDCTHEREPGCTIRAAFEQGNLDPDRFARWRKLTDEDVINSGKTAQRRARPPKQGKRK